MTPEARRRVLADNEQLARRALRVLALAYKDLPEGYREEDLAGGLVFVGLVGMIDPPRPEVRDAVARARRAGIRPIMITGDHPQTALAIARELDITQDGRVLLGTELQRLPDEVLAERVSDTSVYARVNPEHKLRIVRALQAGTGDPGGGQVVAMTGDGVNDAPALKTADIGIAMGITGTEVSKEAAAMILTDDDFSTIVKAVRIGRGLYDNLKKYIQFQMAALIGFIALFLGASIFNVASGVPFVPLQTLWVNFTTQLLQAVGPARRWISSARPSRGRPG